MPPTFIEGPLTTRRGGGTEPEANSWQSLALSVKPRRVIAQAWSGASPRTCWLNYALTLRISVKAIDAALREDHHLHSAGRTVRADRRDDDTAAALGLVFALTDHSPRFDVASSLSPDRLRGNWTSDSARVSLLRILTGSRSTSSNRSLDQEPEMLDRLDIVVTSVHSKLSMDSAAMTRQMVRAVAQQSHRRAEYCARPADRQTIVASGQNQFDAEAVFTATANEHGAVEINSVQERRTTDAPVAP